MNIFQQVESSEQRVESRPPLSGLALRMLVRNAEARIEHLTAWANSVRPGDLMPVDMIDRVEAAHLALTDWRVQLMHLCAAPGIHRCPAAAVPGVCPGASAPGKSPAASSLAKAAPSGDAAQPESPSVP